VIYLEIVPDKRLPVKFASNPIKMDTGHHRHGQQQPCLLAE
jgi:hypothetical protein